MNTTRTLQFRFLTIAALALMVSIALVNCGGGGGGGTAAKTSIKLAQTGQTASFDANAAKADDGALRIGVAWTAQRFTPASSGTGTVVSDNLTGLMWAGDGGTPAFALCTSGTKTWQKALDYVSCINALNYLGHTDWRLPNRKELRSINNYGQANMATWLNTQGFSNVQPSYYWTSTTYSGLDAFAWSVWMNDGEVYPAEKATVGDYVWPVRSGQ